MDNWKEFYDIRAVDMGSGIPEYRIWDKEVKNWVYDTNFTGGMFSVCYYAPALKEVEKRFALKMKRIERILLGKR